MGLLICADIMLAQQDEMYTQFFTNKLAVNPAYAGSKETFNLLALYRTQWVGMDGAPKTISFTAHAPIMKNTSGIGVSLLQDKIGIFQNLIFNFAYTYRIIFPFGKLSLGLSGRIQHMEIDWTKTNPQTYFDNSISFTKNNLFLPNFGAGTYFYNDNLYLGLAVPHLFNNKYKLHKENSTQTESNAERHYFAMAGYMLPLTTDLAFKPAAQLKYVQNAPLELDLNMSLIFYDTFVIGASWRTKDSYSVVCQIWLDKNFACGYSHDFTYTKIAHGSHEIFISYDFAIKGFGVENPRFF